MLADKTMAAPSRRRTRHVWADRLTMAPFVTALLRGGGMTTVFHFAECTPAVAALAARLARWRLPVRLQAVSASVADVDITGRNLFVRVLDIMQFLVACAARHPLGDRWLPPDQRAEEAVWRRILASETYVSCVGDMQMATIMERHYRQNSTEPPDSIILMMKAPLPPEAANGLPTMLDLPAPLRLHAGAGGLLAIIDAMKIARILLLRIYAWLRKGEGPRTRIDPSARQSGIALVQFARDLPDRAPFFPTYDWVVSSGVQPSRVVLLLNRADSPANDENLLRIEAMGHGWVDMPSWTGELDGSPRSVWQMLCAAVRTIPASRLGYDWYLWGRLLQHRTMLAAWRNLIRRLNAVSIHQHQEFIPSTMLLSLAARQEGALFVWQAWSVYVFLMPWYSFAVADLVFAMGPHEAGCYRVAGMHHRWLVETGIAGYEGCGPDDEAVAQDIRRRLTSQPERVLAIFDSSYNTRIHQSTAHAIEFYRLALRLVDETPRWACVIKSKSSAFADLPKDAEIAALLERLVAGNRCLILPPEVRPSIALRAADAAACFSVNSAGFLSGALTGKPVLHLDRAGLVISPLCQHPDAANFHFDDPAAFTAALRAALAGDPAVGRGKTLAARLDPFGDGLGRLRIGRLMKTYLARRDAGDRRDIALDAAIRDFRHTFGDDSVMRPGDQTALSGDPAWRDAMDRYYRVRPDLPEVSA